MDTNMSILLDMKLLLNNYQISRYLYKFYLHITKTPELLILPMYIKVH